MSLQVGSGDRATLGPLLHDPGGDMDCSGDHNSACLIPPANARALMPLATGTVAPCEPLIPSACMVDHGLSEHDSVDGKLGACSLYPASAILFHEEWLAAYHTMSDITRSQCP